MFRQHSSVSQSSHTPSTSQPYFSRILLPKESGNGPVNHSQRRHSLVNGSSSTSSERSKQSYVSAYFARNQNARKGSPSYMPTIFNFQPVNDYHSSALRRRITRAESTKTNLTGTPEPPNSDVTIQRGLWVFESKKRLREPVTANTEESTHSGSDFASSKRRRTSGTFDISTLGCTTDVDGFSFTSLRQLRNELDISNSLPNSSIVSQKNIDQNSKYVQTQEVNECGDKNTEVSTVSTSHVESSRTTTRGSDAALRRKIPYMSPSELEAHLLSTNAVTYLEQNSVDNSSSSSDAECDTLPTVCIRKKCRARRIAGENNQNSGSVVSLNISTPSPISNTADYDCNPETEDSEPTIVKMTSLNRFISNLEGHSDSFSGKMDHSQSKSGSFHHSPRGFDMELRVKRIRELISANSSNQISVSLPSVEAHVTITSNASTNISQPTTQILPNLNRPLVTPVSSSVTNVSSSSSTSFASTIVCSAPSLAKTITTASNALPSSTSFRLSAFPVPTSNNGAVNTQPTTSTTVAATTVVSLPVSTSFGFTTASSVPSPLIPVVTVGNVAATKGASVAFSFPLSTPTAQISSLKEPTTTSTLALSASTPTSFPTFTLGIKTGAASTQTASSVVPSPVFSIPISTATTSTNATVMTVTTATTTTAAVTTAAFSFVFPLTSSTSSPLQTTSSATASATNSASSVFGSVKPASTFGGFSFSKPTSTPLETPSASTFVARTSTQSDSSNKSFNFGASSSQSPSGTASLFAFGVPKTTVSSSDVVSSFSFTPSSAPSFLGSFSNPASVTSSFAFGSNVSKPTTTVASGTLGQSAVTTTTTPLNNINNTGLFNFTSPAASSSGLSIFGSTGSTTVNSIFPSITVSAVSASAIKPLSTPLSVSQSTPFANNPFTLGIKPASVTPSTSSSLFGANNQIFGSTSTPSMKFNFGQSTPSTATGAVTPSVFSFTPTSVTTSATSVTSASTLFQFGSPSSLPKTSSTAVCQTFSFGSSSPLFSFGQQSTTVSFQPTTSTSILNSGLTATASAAIAITTATGFQFASTTVLPGNNSSSSFGGLSFSQTPASAPSVVNPGQNTGFIFGQTGLNTSVSTNPFTFGASNSPPAAARRRPHSSRRSRRA